MIRRDKVMGTYEDGKERPEDCIICDTMCEYVSTVSAYAIPDWIHIHYLTIITIKIRNHNELRLGSDCLEVFDKRRGFKKIIPSTIERDGVEYILINIGEYTLTYIKDSVIQAMYEDIECDSFNKDDTESDFVYVVEPSMWLTPAVFDNLNDAQLYLNEIKKEIKSSL